MSTATDEINKEGLRQAKGTAIANSNATALAGVLPGELTGQIGYWCNFATDPKERFRMVAACNGARVEKGSDWINKPLNLWQWYIQPVELLDKETGELTPTFRCVLVTDDGKLIGFVSQGILKSLALVIQTFGPGPWEPAVQLVLRQIDLGGNKRLYTLEAAD